MCHLRHDILEVAYVQLLYITIGIVLQIYNERKIPLSIDQYKIADATCSGQR